jgi:hypothetical protein
MITVFQCIFPDNKQFIGKTKLPLKKFIHQTTLRANNKPNTIFLWALNKAKGDVKWIEIGSYWSSVEANGVYNNLVNVNQTYDRNFGYNYLTKNGNNWSQKQSAAEKASLSRLRTRLKKLLLAVNNKKLAKSIESVILNTEKYLKTIKDSK